MSYYTESDILECEYSLTKLELELKRISSVANVSTSNLQLSTAIFNAEELEANEGFLADIGTAIFNFIKSILKGIATFIRKIFEWLGLIEEKTVTKESNILKNELEEKLKVFDLNKKANRANNKANTNNNANTDSDEDDVDRVLKKINKMIDMLQKEPDPVKREKGYWEIKEEIANNLNILGELSPEASEYKRVLKEARDKALSTKMPPNLSTLDDFREQLSKVDEFFSRNIGRREDLFTYLTASNNYTLAEKIYAAEKDEDVADDMLSVEYMSEILKKENSDGLNLGSIRVEYVDVIDSKSKLFLASVLSRVGNNTSKPSDLSKLTISTVDQMDISKNVMTLIAFLEQNWLTNGLVKKVDTVIKEAHKNLADLVNTINKYKGKDIGEFRTTSIDALLTHSRSQSRIVPKELRTLGDIKVELSKIGLFIKEFRVKG